MLVNAEAMPCRYVWWGAAALVVAVIAVARIALNTTPASVTPTTMPFQLRVDSTHCLAVQGTRSMSVAPCASEQDRSPETQQRITLFQWKEDGRLCHRHSSLCVEPQTYGAATVGEHGGLLETRTDAHGRVGVWNQDGAWLVYNASSNMVEWAPWTNSTDMPPQAAMFMEYQYPAS